MGVECHMRLCGDERAGLRRSAFLLCIGFNVVLQFTASTLGEEKIELMVDTFLKAAVAAMPFAGSLN